VVIGGKGDVASYPLTRCPSWFLLSRPLILVTTLVTAQAQATVALAVIRGLMLDDNATGEQSRIDGAFAIFDGL
jgi:hypothetical protein